MSDRWEYYPCQMGDDRAFIFVDIGIRDEIESLPPHTLRLRIAFQQPTELGMPGSDEYEPLGQFEDSLVDLLKAYDSVYIGRITVDGHRHFYVATPEAEDEVWARRIHRLPNPQNYDLAFFTEANEVADAYWNELYPKADDWRIIKDIQVIEVLKKRGDDGTTPRTVDHWTYFSTLAAADQFHAWAQEEGYAMQEPELREEGKYCVRLAHHGTIQLADISSHTIKLLRQADAYGGEYDGWETVLLEKQNDPFNP